ncbi:uncharacterized protein MYCGRDRAFT_91932 [Zymoseptoria tritici IPO323]|uniref:Uncharacterized protein n=1 Tax=Zymoseptoria tritici (strain CBS 115943 / IPO323) TaxID=336722 RepID=F9X7X7_ZYMTI|nr:uncharacterized protein MYCGRDRAFT_91932 [Zymoseptoria tritici IPO323]EGP89278.1 hypothetical protein MYCGRDRAFT_91932 [Zymoseptoria tritici IPO323]
MYNLQTCRPSIATIDRIGERNTTIQEWQASVEVGMQSVCKAPCPTQFISYPIRQSEKQEVQNDQSIIVLIIHKSIEPLIVCLFLLNISLSMSFLVPIFQPLHIPTSHSALGF